MTARRTIFLLANLVLLAAAPFIGATPDGPTGRFVLVQIRIPQVLMGALVGGMLSLVGAAYQTIFANPLAAPSTVGTTAGATLGALLVIVLGAGQLVAGLSVLVVAAFLGALAITGVVMLVAATEHARVEDILLAGIAATLAASALASGLQFAADMSATFAAVQWSLGQLAQVGYRNVIIVLPFFIPTAILLLSQTRALETLVGGEQRAHSQGVDVPKVRLLTIGAGALGVAACVATCGPIAFVGLVVPHIVRLSVGASRRVLLPMSMLVGATFLVYCDVAARLLLPGRALPVGVVTAAIGAPILIWLVITNRGRRY